MDQTERQVEISYLNLVLDEVRGQLHHRQGILRNSQTELQAALNTYWESKSANVWDQAQQAEAVDRQRSLVAASYQRQSRLKRMAEAPYFGRIDFKELSRDPQQVYIGIASLVKPETGEYLIYDWRSPVAGMFYDYEPGPASYQCPAGTIQGAMTLKRQYRIVHGELGSFFDTDLKIDDEILQEILSQSADVKMRTIVNSIQREQNRIIRDLSHRLLLVQGPAGSGKTSIALHRAAFILYQERQTLTARNILILSPNQIFSNYISGVLPELGEENVLQTTFREYLFNFKPVSNVNNEDREAQLEYLLDQPAAADHSIRVAAISYKSSPAFVQLIRDYLTLLETDLLRDYPTIEFKGRTVFSPAEWQRFFGKNLAYLPPSQRLAQLKKVIQVKLRPIVNEIRRAKEAEIAAGGEEVNEKTIKAMARLAARQELDSLLNQLDRLTNLSSLGLYRRLFADPQLWPSLSAGTELPESWPEICSQTLSRLDQGLVPYEDSLPLFFFHGMLEGFPVKNTIRHLIIDEAQDYSLLHFEVLKHLFPRASWTVLGDPDQTINPYQHGIAFESLAAVLEVNEAIMIQLSRSYRSTREIQAFCRALLENAPPVDYVDRPGPRPTIIKLTATSNHVAVLLATITKFQSSGCHSIAVLCKTAREATDLYQSLPEQTGITLVTREIDEFQPGVLIIPIYLAKGLEFDGVLVPNASVSAYTDGSDRRLLYIACTRALHRLTLCYHGAPSPLLRINPDLYLEQQV